MDKKSLKKRKNIKSEKDETNKEEYGYDFIPSLNEWVNIDEQKKIVNKLEKISDEDK